MPKFKHSEIGDAGVAFVYAMGSRQPGRYFRAVDSIINYPGSSVGEVLQHLDANGFEYAGHHWTLYTFDPDTYTGAALRAALEEYGDAREAEIAAKKAKRRGRS